MPTGTSEEGSRAAQRALSLQAGHVIRCAHRALAAAGEPAPEFEHVTPSVTADGHVVIRLSLTLQGRRALDDLGPHDRLYALLVDESGVYERTCPQPGTDHHRRVGFDGTVERLRAFPL